MILFLAFKPNKPKTILMRLPCFPGERVTGRQTAHRVIPILKPFPSNTVAIIKSISFELWQHVILTSISRVPQQF
jgi:hypothetical protein